MDNQHRRISGYRDLTGEEIGLMNECKALAEQCGALIEKLRTTKYESNVPSDDHADGSPTVEKVSADQRSVALAATNLQQGFMWLARSVAKPTTF